MAKYRDKLSPAETGMYDLMRKSSEILRELAGDALVDVRAILKDLEVEDAGDLVVVERAKELQHDVVTYAFTLGVQFAVNRQQEVAHQVAKKLGLIDEGKKN